MKIVIISEKDPALLFPGPAVTSVVVKTADELTDHRDADVCIDLDFTLDEARLSALGALPSSLIVVNSVVHTLAEIDRPFIRINGWPGFLEREVHELVVPDKATERRITEIYETLGHSCTIVPDTPGMITARILATIINEAWYTWEEGVSTKEEIDTAMKLGTNYPFGPFEWSQRIGLLPVLQLLAALSETDPCYTPANSLQEAVGSLK